MDMLIIWYHWEVSKVNPVESWISQIEGHELVIDKDDRGWKVSFYPADVFNVIGIQLGYYPTIESAKIAAEIYYYSRKKNGTL